MHQFLSPLINPLLVTGVLSGVPSSSPEVPRRGPKSHLSRSFCSATDVNEVIAPYLLIHFFRTRRPCMGQIMHFSEADPDAVEA